MIIFACKLIGLMSHHYLDELDKKILKLISEDARTPFLEVARACNVSGAAIHQRVQKLTTLGVLKGSQFVVDPVKIGYETCAYVALYLREPERHDAVVEALKQVPEVVECHCVTGSYDILLKLYAHDNAHLMSLLNAQVQTIAGVVSTETLVCLDESIRRELPIHIADEK